MRKWLAGGSLLFAIIFCGCTSSGQSSPPPTSIKAGPNDKAACVEFDIVLRAGLSSQKVTAADRDRLYADLAAAENADLRAKGSELASATKAVGVSNAAKAILATCQDMGFDVGG